MLTLALTASAALAGVQQPWMNVNDPPETRAKALLAKMTLEEKLVMLHGDTNKTGGLPYVGNVPGNERLNIPPLTLNDGPQGFRDNANPGTTTAWPSGLTMAASFDKDIMFDFIQRAKQSATAHIPTSRKSIATRAAKKHKYISEKR